MKMHYPMPRLIFTTTETLSLRSILFFILLFVLCIRLHEYFHVLSAVAQHRSFTSGFGKVSNIGGNQIMNSASGPMVSYLLMWIGLFLLLYSKQMIYTGFYLIFSSCPLFRMTNTRQVTLFGGWDELRIAGELSIPYPLTVAAILFIVLPPLLTAYFSIASKYRALWFGYFFLIIPICAYGIIYFGDTIVMPAVRGHQSDGGLIMRSFHGIPAVLILFDVLVIIGLLMTNKNHKSSSHAMTA
jgi:hypothetical protein